MPGYSVHGGSKGAAEYLVQVLAHEVGARGVTVNAIRPTAAEGVGLLYTTCDPHRRSGASSRTSTRWGGWGRPMMWPTRRGSSPATCRCSSAGQSLLVSGGAIARRGLRLGIGGRRRPRRRRSRHGHRAGEPPRRWSDLARLRWPGHPSDGWPSSRQASEGGAAIERTGLEPRGQDRPHEDCSSRTYRSGRTC